MPTDAEWIAPRTGRRVRRTYTVRSYHADTGVPHQGYDNWLVIRDDYNGRLVTFSPEAAKAVFAELGKALIKIA